jgi:hypothetical protein
MGKKKPKKADTAGGSTPETMLKEVGEFWAQFSRNGTKLEIFVYTIRGKSGRRKA